MGTYLTGRVILIAEDEPLIALDITQAFEAEGARVIMAHTLNEALVGVEDAALSAAILDHALSDGDSSTVCRRMKERNIPFVNYSGYDAPEGPCREGVHVNKPESVSVLVDTVKGLIAERRFQAKALPIAPPRQAQVRIAEGRSEVAHHHWHP